MKPDPEDLIAAAVNQATEEGRKRLGGPPTDEELLAYRHGKLAPEERDLMEERLAHHPEAVRRLLRLPKPPERGTPIVADSISDEELSEEWALLQSRLAVGRPISPPKPEKAPKVWILAAAASLLMGAIGIGTATVAWRDAGSPKTSVQDLYLFPEEARRGPGADSAARLEPTFKHYVVTLQPKVDREFDYPRYRLEIASADASEQTVWSTDEIPRSLDGTFRLLLPVSFLDRGTYQLRLFGLRDGEATPLSVYRLRAP